MSRLLSISALCGLALLVAGCCGCPDGTGKNSDDLNPRVLHFKPLGGAAPIGMAVKKPDP
jgi:hypothetical protein